MCSETSAMLYCNMMLVAVASSLCFLIQEGCLVLWLVFIVYCYMKNTFDFACCAVLVLAVCISAACRLC